MDEKQAVLCRTKHSVLRIFCKNTLKTEKNEAYNETSKPERMSYMKSISMDQFKEYRFLSGITLAPHSGNAAFICAKTDNVLCML